MFSMKEVKFQIFNLNSLFRGVKTIFWAKVVSEVSSSFNEQKTLVNRVKFFIYAEKNCYSDKN